MLSRRGRVFPSCVLNVFVLGVMISCIRHAFVAGLLAARLRLPPLAGTQGLLLSLRQREFARGEFCESKTRPFCISQCRTSRAYGNTSAGYSLRFSPTHKTTRLCYARHHF